MEMTRHWSEHKNAREKMLESDLGVGDTSFIKDESAHLDYVEQIQDICHLDTILALRAYMVIECSLSFQLSSSNPIQGDFIQMVVPQLRGNAQDWR